MNKKKKSDDLDARLKKELLTMLDKGYALAPISRPALQKRLGLKSRGTLAVNHRAQIIDEARLRQLTLAGLDSDGKKKRNGPAEQNKVLKERITVLEKERDSLVEKLALIINGCQARGYNVYEIMLPIRNYPSSR
jgi:hypothetical protein